MKASECRNGFLDDYGMLEVRLKSRSDTAWGPSFLRGSETLTVLYTRADRKKAYSRQKSESVVT